MIAIYVSEYERVSKAWNNAAHDSKTMIVKKKRRTTDGTSTSQSLPPVPIRERSGSLALPDFFFGPRQPDSEQEMAD